ncbi:MAG: hypothetical protein J5U17_04630 [Candidatus Methanoperedens sp.]|nr:hypothetical protein [Candidatus Methanoperedens sp.]
MRRKLKNIWIENKKKLTIAISVLLIIAGMIIGGAQIIRNYQSEKENKKILEPSKPSVSIGCSQVVRENKELILKASTSNIDNPSFQWFIDGINSGNSSNMQKDLDLGAHKILVNVSFGTQAVSASKEIIVINSTDGVAISDFQYSTNQWGFMTNYLGEEINVEGVIVLIDSSRDSSIPPCGPLVTDSLFAGVHKWMASYQGKLLGQGSFNLKEAAGLKIIGIQTEQQYNAGDTVNGKIILENRGTITIKGFDIKTLAVNENYAWMGEKARREFYDRYDPELIPGQRYEIPVRVKIPESVSGIRPSGRYNITITVLFKDQTIADSRSITTQVT